MGVGRLTHRKYERVWVEFGAAGLETDVGVHQDLVVVAERVGGEVLNFETRTQPSGEFSRSRMLRVIGVGGAGSLRWVSRESPW